MLYDRGIFSRNLVYYVGVNIGGAGSYVYEAPANSSPPASTLDSAPKPQEKWVPASSRPPSKGTNSSRDQQQLTYCDLNRLNVQLRPQYKGCRMCASYF